jgi:2-oxoglutarate dehydrogenase E1 component
VARKQVHVQSLIAAYRFLGSRWADLDPLKRTERPKIPELEPAFYDLSESDMDITFSAANTYFGKAENMTLREIVQALRETYCGTIGAEFMHCTDPAEKRWWQERLESIRSKPTFSADQKKHILDRLTAAEGLERYLHTKYVGQKRFSLEGGESFIASMDEVVQRAGTNGVQEIVIGMAHRGRLNVLVNTLGKMPKDLFAEFDHTAPEELPAGDVKYHQGFSSDISTPGGPVHLSLAFNPSHLEIVNPVVEGSVKARMDRRGDKDGKQVLPVLVHGDAAFAGQGVVMETLALAQTRGYYTGGTVHLVINNQIGFTTSDPRDSALHAVLHRRRQDDRGAGAARERRRPRSRGAVHAAGDGLPPAVQQGRGGRHHLLPQAGPQRAGHAQPDAAADVQGHRQAPGHAQAVWRQAGDAGCAARRRPDQMVKDLRAAIDAGRHTVDPVLTNFKSKYAVDWAPFLGKKWTDAPTPRCRWPRSSAWPSADHHARPTSRCTRWWRR